MAFFEGIKMTAGYGDGPDIINSCNINANRGEIVAILGPNGAGKSTAMKAMLGLLTLKSASVCFDGEDISKINWNYSSNENTFASKGQKFIYWGPLKPLEKILLRSKISPWAFFASDIYHNKYWLRFIGKRRIKKAMKTRWGKLFQKY